MSSDIKVRLIEANCYYYPDVVVTCHPDDLQGDEDYIHHPTVVIEVLFKSTAKFDGLRPTIGHRTTKFADYQTCPELEEYVRLAKPKNLLKSVPGRAIGGKPKSTKMAIEFSSKALTGMERSMTFIKKSPDLPPKKP